MNTYDYNENSQMTDDQRGMNATQAKKAPNIFKQLIYSVMPGKYGELANVKVKGFIFYYLFWCLIMCSVTWTAMLTISLVEGLGERLANGYVLAYDKLPIVILILVGISIPICLIVTIIAAVISAIGYCFEGLPAALIIKAISKKQCSLFDLYKSAVYCQTPVNIAMLCMMVSLELFDDLSWMSLPIGIARIVSLVIMIFGIRNLPAKSFIPGNNQTPSGSNRTLSESNLYKPESRTQSIYTQEVPKNATGYWRCSCGRQNPPYTGTCACGKNKY